jgi:hypothetical protein
VAAYLLTSRARRSFKQQLGSANHLIITALVGLDAVERGAVKEVPEELHAAWSPKDSKASARRSRRLLLDMALVRAVDAIDVYIRESIRKPRLVQSPTLRSAVDKAGQSIFKKLSAFETHYPELDSIPVALVGLMVAWRNRSAHAEADNEPLRSHRQTIESCADQIAERFRSLDSKLLLSDWDSEHPPTFKEVASFINAAHHYVSELGRAQLQAIDQELFLKDLIWKAVSFTAGKAGTIDQVRRRRLRSVWGKDPSERKRYVQNFLRQHGLAFDVSGTTTVIFDDDLIAKLSNMSPSEVLRWITPTETDDFEG